MNNARSLPLLLTAAGLVGPVAASAEQPYQPPGANLTLGDVTHGQRAQSASGNPAAGAADYARANGRPLRGFIVSAAGGIEYGNFDEIFELIDRVSEGYQPSPPDADLDLPTQLPELRPGLDLGQVWDSLDPDAQAALSAVAKEVATQAALLAVISTEGYARAWVSADVPILVGKNYWGGTWSFNVNWSGASKAFGLAQPIEFDLGEAEDRLNDWISQLPGIRPPVVALSDDVIVSEDPATNALFLKLTNDSSLIAKSAQTTDLGVGYSRPAWSGESGTLYLGAEGHLLLQRLSRYSARFGDITNSEELFDEIRNADFRSDQGFSVDLGALWVGRNYQLGAQIKNLNEPTFEFPDVNLAPYSNPNVIDFLRRDRTFTMERQLKLEGSWFGAERHWSLHAGVDANEVTDVLGDQFQWATLGIGYRSDGVWVPSARIGYRRNLAGTEVEYLSAGITAFKFLNLDVASALNKVRIDGRNLPQGLMVSLGFNILW